MAELAGEQQRPINTLAEIAASRLLAQEQLAEAVAKVAQARMVLISELSKRVGEVVLLGGASKLYLDGNRRRRFLNDERLPTLCRVPFGEWRILQEPCEAYGQVDATVLIQGDKQPAYADGLYLMIDGDIVTMPYFTEPEVMVEDEGQQFSLVQPTLATKASLHGR